MPHFPQVEEPPLNELNQLIAPEILDDEFSFLLTRLVAQEELNTILEIGASSGAGSTEAIYQGIVQNPGTVEVYSMEVSAPRFAALQERYAREPRMHGVHASSIRIDEFPTEQEVAAFYHAHKTNLNRYPLERVLEWLKQDVDYIKQNGVPQGGIDLIKKKAGVKVFDLVLIDGSEFTGAAELKQVYGAKLILLDDIFSFKNYQNNARLQKDPLYESVISNLQLRNGYAVFKRRDMLLRGGPYPDLLRTFRSKESSLFSLKRIWRRLRAKLNFN